MPDWSLFAAHGRQTVPRGQPPGGVSRRAGRPAGRGEHPDDSARHPDAPVTGGRAGHGSSHFVPGMAPGGLISWISVPAGGG